MEIIEIGSVVGAILVICQAVKMAGVKSKYIPLLAILLGVGGAFMYGGIAWDSSLVGIILGLGTTLGFREVKTAFVS
jgi:uncharacterized membrane protein YecN with MAPEG domain